MLDKEIVSSLPGILSAVSSVLFSFDLDRSAFNTPIRVDRTMSAKVVPNKVHKPPTVLGEVYCALLSLLSYLIYVKLQRNSSREISIPRHRLRIFICNESYLGYHRRQAGLITSLVIFTSLTEDSACFTYTPSTSHVISKIEKCVVSVW